MRNKKVNQSHGKSEKVRAMVAKYSAMFDNKELELLCIVG